MTFPPFQHSLFHKTLVISTRRFLFCFAALVMSLTGTGFDIDEASDKTVAEQLRDALSRAAVQVVDLFRDWDGDNNGKVSRGEFHKAMAELQFNVPASDIDELFTEWDPDGSGALELKELEKLLRRGSAVKLDAKLQAGGAGEIVTTSGNKHAIRKGKVERPVSQGAVLLRGFDIDEDSDKTVAEQLHDALSRSATRVVDLFREWDDDSNGKVSRKEFHKALGFLQFNVPTEDIDALFDVWDPDDSGLLTLDELQKELRRGASIHPKENKPKASASEPLLRPATLAGAISQSHDALAAIKKHLNQVGFDRAHVALPKVKPPPARKRLPPPPGMVWNEEQQRYVSKAEQLLGKGWRKKMHERGLFWDAATQSFINKGQSLMMRAPGGPSAKQSLVAPELHRARVGIGSESEARQMGFRLDTPTRSRVASDSAWEVPLLHGQYGSIKPPGTLGFVGSLSAWSLSGGSQARVWQARQEQQSRFRKDLGQVHASTMHGDFLARPAKGAKGRSARAVPAATLTPPRRSTMSYDMKQPAG